MRSATDGAEPTLVLRLAAETLAMVRFYSRLAIPSLGPFDNPAGPPTFATACRMLPVASLIIALPAAVAITALGLTALPTLAVAAMAVAVGVATTGALHEDGLADVADGFGGGQTVERKLEIMKDSRVGSYGAIALVLALVLRTSLLAGLLVRSPLAAGVGLIGAAVFSRVASLVVFAALPTARAHGVAGRVGRPTFGATAAALVVGSVIALVAAMLAAGPLAAGDVGALAPAAAHAAAATVLAALAAFALARLALAEIGGQTGDVIGAAQQVSELGFLLGLLLW